MPMYEYKCGTCGKVFEVRQKFSDEPLKIHKGCGGPVQRLISPPAFQFKGSGWYVTDYAKSAGGMSAPNGNGKSEAAKPAKTEKKTETSTTAAKKD